MSKKPKPATGEAWGILNPYGDLWTRKTFDTEEAARQHVRAWWSWNPEAGGDLSKFKPVRVKVRVTVLPTTTPEVGRIKERVG